MADSTVLKLSFKSIIVHSFSWIATTIVAATPNVTLVQVLEMKVAPLTDHDYLVLLYVLLLCTRRLPNLHTLKLFTPSNIWTPLFRDTILERRPSSLTNVYIYISDPDNSTEALVIARNNYFPWQRRLYLALPLDRLVDIITYDSRLLPYLRELVIFAPQCLPSLPIEAVVSSLLSISGILTSLRKVQLAVASTSIEAILQALITFPVLHEIKLVFPQPLLGAIKFGIQVALYRGMDQFHHLRKLTIPGELFCSMVLNRLGQLEDLRHLKITSALALPYSTLSSNPPPFRALRSLDVGGPLFFIDTLASILPPCPSVRSLSLSVTSLQSRTDSENTLSKLSTLFPRLKNLTYKVKRLHESETSRWFNIQPLLDFSSLAKVVIEHPHALALSSSTMRKYLQAWPTAKVVLLNPNPVLGHWRNEKGIPSILPNYDTLADLADFKRFKEFGVYLDNPQIIWDHNQVFLGRPNNTTLERLTLGTVLTLDKRTHTAIQRKFPNATIFSS